MMLISLSSGGIPMFRCYLLICGFVLGATSAHAQTSSSCLMANAHSQQLLSYVRELVSSADPGRVQIRTALGLPAMDSTQVTLITNNRTCAKVAQGINTDAGTTGLARQLYVLSVGSYYVAQDPGHPSGEWWPKVSLDRQYRVLGVVL